MSDSTSDTPKRPDRLENLKAKKAALEAQIAALNAAATKEKRKRDNHRKILAGAIVLEEAERDPRFAAWLREQLNRGLTRERDRAAFNLPPLAPANDTQSNAEKGTSPNEGSQQSTGTD